MLQYSLEYTHMNKDHGYTKACTSMFTDVFFKVAVTTM